MREVAGLVLAAGAGTRFGGPKAVVELAGERLVARAVRTLSSAGLTRTYVVSGSTPLVVAGAVVVHNPDWASGMGSSLRAGLAAMPETIDAAVVVLVDQVGLTPDAVRRLVAVASSPDTLATASYEGRRGHPVVLGRGHWSEVARSAVGDVGARAVLQAHAAEVTVVECGDVGTDADVDRPEQLERFADGGGERRW